MRYCGTNTRKWKEMVNSVHTYPTKVNRVHKLGENLQSSVSSFPNHLATGSSSFLFNLPAADPDARIFELKSRRAAKAHEATRLYQQFASSRQFLVSVRAWQFHELLILHGWNSAPGGTRCQHRGLCFPVGEARVSPNDVPGTRMWERDQFRGLKYTRAPGPEG